METSAKRILPISAELLRRWVIHTLTVCVSLIVFAISIHLLWTDLNRNAENALGTPIATLNHSGQDVRKRSSHSFVWAPATNSTPLIKNDAISVGSESTATIQFQNGSIIELGSDSLFVIKESEDIQLGFVKGSFIFRTQTGDALIQVDGSGKQQRQELKLRIVSPQQREIFYVQPFQSRQIAFTWQSILPRSESPLTLQIGLDRRYSKTRKFPLGNASRGTAHLSLPTGNYYWRILEGTKSITESRSFIIEKLEAPKLIAPLGMNLSQGHPIPFQWKDRLDQFETVPVTWELAKNKEFSPILRTETFQKAPREWLVSPLTPGTYFWRIRLSRNRTRITSETGVFQILNTPPSAIQLHHPIDNADYHPPLPIRFTWEAEGNFQEFKLFLQHGNQRKDWTTKGSDFIWETPTVGRYEWYIQGKSNAGQIVSSPKKTFLVLEEKPVQLLAPKEAERFLYWHHPAVTFEWRHPDARPGDHEYQLAFYAANNVTNPIRTYKTSRPPFKVNLRDLPQGSLSWQILTFNSSNELINRSKRATFTSSVLPLLGEAQPLSPTNGIHWNTTTKASRPLLSWKQMPHAKAYKVKLQDQNGTLIKEIETPETSWRVPRLVSGSYFWTVNAIDPLGREGKPSSTQLFHIEKTKLKAPEEIQVRFE